MFKFNPISQMLVVKDTYMCFPFIKKIINVQGITVFKELQYDERLAVFKELLTSFVFSDLIN